MEKQIFTTEDVNLILNNLRTPDRARIYEAGTQRPFSIQKIDLDLSVAKLDTNPFRVGFPFKSVWVSAATDVGVVVNIKIGSRDTTQSSLPLHKNDSLPLDFPTSEAYLDWPAQPGKTLSLTFFTDAEFRPGTQISQISGGFAISSGSIVGPVVPVTLVALTAALIAPALATRIVATIQNKTGADIFISGSSAVTDDGTIATAGIKVPPDGIIYHRNTGALYGYSVGGGNVNRVEES